MSDNLPPTIMSRHLWCHKHLSPLQPDWPRGYALAMVGLFQEGASDPRIAAEVGDSDNPNGAIQAAFNRHKPLCCFLPAGIAEAIIASALRGETYWNPAWPEEMRPKKRQEQPND